MYKTNQGHIYGGAWYLLLSEAYKGKISGVLAPLIFAFLLAGLCNTLK